MFLGKQFWDTMMGKEEYPGTSYHVTEKGWMTERAFFHWFKNFLLPHISNEPKNLVIYDGHLSHVSFELIQLAISHNVTILKLPPHTSHILQPLDVCVFRSLKSDWDKNLSSWAKTNIGKKLSKTHFSNVLGRTWTGFNWEANLKSGFKHTGIFDMNYPMRVNSSAIPESSYHPEKLKRYKLFVQGNITIFIELTFKTKHQINQL